MDVYDVIKRPLISEKSSLVRSNYNQYCFVVDSRATKQQIKAAVEKLFGVKVTEVRAMNYHGKRKRMGRNVGKTSDWKKAIVSLAEGMKIDLFEGV